MFYIILKVSLTQTRFLCILEPPSPSIIKFHDEAVLVFSKSGTSFALMDLMLVHGLTGGKTVHIILTKISDFKPKQVVHTLASISLQILNSF